MPGIPKLIIANEIEEEKGHWIDPYANKRRKNRKQKERREQKRRQSLLKPPSSDSDSEDSIMVTNSEPSMWATN